MGLSGLLLLDCLFGGTSLHAQSWGTQARGSVSVRTPAGTGDFDGGSDSGFGGPFHGAGVDSNVRCDTFGDTTGCVRASFINTAALGVLSAKCYSSAVTSGGNSPNGMSAISTASPLFLDTFTFTNTSLPPNAPLTVRIYQTLSDRITLDGRHDLPFDSSGATLSLIVAGNTITSLSHASEGPAYQRKVIEISVPNGTATSIGLTLQLATTRLITRDLVPGGSISVDATNGAAFAIELVTPDMTYSTTSGTQYAVTIPDALPRITAIDRVAGSMRISFTTVLGRNYKVEFNDGLTSGAWTGLPGQEIVPGTGGVVQVTDGDSSSHVKRFYRAVLLL